MYCNNIFVLQIASISIVVEMKSVIINTVYVPLIVYFKPLLVGVGWKEG